MRRVRFEQEGWTKHNRDIAIVHLWGEIAHGMTTAHGITTAHDITMVDGMTTAHDVSTANNNTIKALRLVGLVSIFILSCSLDLSALISQICY